MNTPALSSTKSDFNVEVVMISAVVNHPNGDRLDIATVNGTPCIVRRGDFHTGDRAVFIPVDALVPVSRPEFAFLADKKRPAKTHARIRAMKLRGVYSEGLLIHEAYCGFGPQAVGTNVQAALGIEKYLTPDERAENATGSSKQVGSKRSLAAKVNKIMPVYGLDSVRRFPNAIPVGTPVVITEKIHGTNARYTYQEGRFWIGSHRTLRRVSSHRIITALKVFWAWLVGLVMPQRAKGFYAETHGDVWVKVAEQHNLEAICKRNPGLVFYGEIYGNGLQVRGGVRFDYDQPMLLGKDKYGFRVFDILDSKTGEYLSLEEMRMLCLQECLFRVPEVIPNSLRSVWMGIEKEEWITKGSSLLADHIREGVVVRTDVYKRDKNRQVLKFVSQDYKLLGGGEED